MKPAWHSVLLIAGGILIAGILAIPAGLEKPSVVARRYRWWNDRIENAGAYLTEIGTATLDGYGEIVFHYRSAYRLDQSVTFERTACTLRIVEKWRLPGWEFHGWGERGDYLYYTIESSLRLGSIRLLYITPGVDIQADWPRIKKTPHVYRVFISNEDTQSVKRTSTWDLPSMNPKETVDWVEEFYVVSEGPISQLADTFAYLDRWCGNPKKLERSPSSRPQEYQSAAR